MIEIIDEGEWTRPAMAPGTLDRQYFEAAAQGRLVIQRCPSCDHRQFPPKLICTNCGADPEWLEAAGEGVIHTFTIVRRHGVDRLGRLFEQVRTEALVGLRLVPRAAARGPQAAHRLEQSVHVRHGTRAAGAGGW